MATERLQKILARAGCGSRRACEELIAAGRVAVDGEVVTEPGSQADPQVQEVTLDGEPVRPERLVYYLLNKPPGFLCSLRAERGRPLAVDLVRDPRRLYTVGRLDEASQGLIVVTNDGALTQRLTHPSYRVPKEYRATVDGPVEPAALKKLRVGVYLAEGRTAPARVKLVRRGRRAELAVEISEGLNRQVRRMLAAVGLKVRRLVRVRIGDIELGRLAPGRCRRLSAAEVRALLSAAEPGPSRPPRRSRRPQPDREPRARGGRPKARGAKPKGKRGKPKARGVQPKGKRGKPKGRGGRRDGRAGRSRRR